MQQVWKFVLEHNCEIDMPSGAELLSVAAQGEDIYLWAKVAPDAPKVKRCFVVFGTGHDIPDGVNLTFVGTAFLQSGSMVFHVFERTTT